MSRDLITPTQRLVLERMALGDRYAEGAVALGMRENTYRTHVQSILTRLHVRTAAGAVGQAYRLGILGDRDTEGRHVRGAA